MKKQKINYKLKVEKWNDYSHEEFLKNYDKIKREIELHPEAFSICRLSFVRENKELAISAFKSCKSSNVNTIATKVLRLLLSPAKNDFDVLHEGIKALKGLSVELQIRMLNHIQNNCFPNNQKTIDFFSNPEILFSLYKINPDLLYTISLNIKHNFWKPFENSLKNKNQDEMEEIFHLSRFLPELDKEELRVLNVSFENFFGDSKVIKRIATYLTIDTTERLIELYGDYDDVDEDDNESFTMEQIDILKEHLQRSKINAIISDKVDEKSLKRKFKFTN